jgi:hypothetical protein
MQGDGRKAHWETVYATKAEDEVSWFQADPARIARSGVRAGRHAAA